MTDSGEAPKTFKSDGSTYSSIVVVWRVSKRSPLKSEKSEAIMVPVPGLVADDQRRCGEIIPPEKGSGKEGSNYRC